MLAPRLRLKLSARTGSTGVDLAVLLPALALLSVIATDFARFFYCPVVLENCARDGAAFASHLQGVAHAPDLSPVPTMTTRYAASADGPFTLTAPEPDADGLPTGYVQVTATWEFHPLIKYPGVPDKIVLSRSSRMPMAPVIR
jgi:hypothetical protein